MSDELQKLLKFIVHHYTGREEAKEIERDASSAEPGSEIVANQRKVLREEEQRAESLTSPFREGIERAYAAYRAGGNAISLDDRNPRENEIADAMIHFLVGHGMATSITRETEPLHYIYTISVDWNRLMSVAQEAHVDLDGVIGERT